MTDIVDTSRMPPIAMERPGRLQADCERLHDVATSEELPRLQAIYDQGGYYSLDVDELLFMRELELRAGK